METGWKEVISKQECDLFTCLSSMINKLMSQCFWNFNPITACIRIQIHPQLSPCKKNLNSKWIRDFSIKPDTLYFIIEKLGTTLELTSSGNGIWTEHQ